MRKFFAHSDGARQGGCFGFYIAFGTAIAFDAAGETGGCGGRREADELGEGKGGEEEGGRGKSKDLSIHKFAIYQYSHRTEFLSP